MLILWKDSFSVDGGVIDADHKFLISIANQILELILHDAPSVSIVQKLASLKMFAEKHFDREKELQQLVCFPEHASHMELHKKLMDDLAVAIEQISSIAQGQSGEEGAVERFNNTKRFINRWLLAHIITEDKKMKPYVDAMRQRSDSMVPLDIAI